MIKNTDFLIYNRPKVEGTQATKGNAAQPNTPGVWQKEALDTLGMYAPNEGKFSAVGEQLTLFPMDPVSSVKKLDLDAPDVPVAHWSDFRFWAKDTISQLQAPKPTFVPGPAAPIAPTHAPDAVSATNGQLLVDGKTEVKVDHFPGRVNYTEGGLYPAGKADDPKVIAQQRNAPNYRKMPGKPVHGVGQPTKQGFRDVLTHLDGKKKPVVWTNTRAEAVIYIDGAPHNLRELASHENLMLKEGATGAEVEALEDKLKQILIAKGSIEVADEVMGPDGKAHRQTRKINVTAENTQTTKEVIDDMRAEGYKVEYKRIPMADEKSPTPAQIDATREWMNEAQAKNPNSKLDYVFNCHQGRGRTTTGMVAAGIALDGRTKQLELPFMTLGENARERADRIIDDNFHMQNLRETVTETQLKAADQDKKAKQLEASAGKEHDPTKKAQLEADAQAARDKKAKYDGNATDFTKRYATMQKYSEYIDKFGANAKTPNFDEWMKGDAQIEDLDKKWVALNAQLGLSTSPSFALA